MEITKTNNAKVTAILLAAALAAVLLAMAAAAKPAEAAFPGKNGKIAFVSDRDGNKEIYVMGADGSNQIRLTSNAASSPDYSRG